MKIAYGPFMANVIAPDEPSIEQVSSRYLPSSRDVPANFSISFGSGCREVCNASDFYTATLRLDSQEDKVEVTSAAWTATVWANDAQVRLRRRFSSLPADLDAIIHHVGICWTLLSGGLLLHASAALSNIGALVFSGRSGEGKSTMAQRIAGDDFIADDHTVLCPTDSGWSVHSTCTSCRPSGPLARLFFIEQSGTWGIARLGTASALRRVLRNTVLPQGNAGLNALVLANAAAIVENSDIYGLSVSLKEMRYDMLVG